MENPHTAEELASLSTFIHNLAGWTLALLGATLLVESVRGQPAGRARFVWPVLGALIGFGLTAFIYFHMTAYHKVSAFADPAQVQHQLIGLFLGAGAAGETLRRAGRLRGRFAELCWPVALLGVGVAFLIHEQARFEALLVHWALAGTVVLAGLAHMAAVLSGEPARALRVFAVLLMLAASAQLIVFRELPGAHGDHGSPEKPAGEAPASGEHTGH